MPSLNVRNTCANADRGRNECVRVTSAGSDPRLALLTSEQSLERCFCSGMPKPVSVTVMRTRSGLGTDNVKVTLLLTGCT